MSEQPKPAGRSTAATSGPFTRHRDESICLQAGYLPVPLRHCDPDDLAGIEVFVYEDPVPGQGRDEHSEEGDPASEPVDSSESVDDAAPESAGETEGLVGPDDDPGGPSYVRYQTREALFGQKDIEDLAERDVSFVYIPLRFHESYYRTMERHLRTILQDSSIPKEARAEILYGCCLSLIETVMRTPSLSVEDIQRAYEVTGLVAELIGRDRSWYLRLFPLLSHDYLPTTHIVNVCLGTVALGVALGDGCRVSLHELAMSGLLHDIGKRLISPEILEQVAPLSDEQLALVRSHVTGSVEQLQSLDAERLLSVETLAGIGEHHERMDGSGYPSGLKGAALSFAGRAVAVVDSFDAMTSVRPYSPEPRSVESALRTLQEESPSRYDSHLVNAFAQLIELVVAPNGTLDILPTVDASCVHSDRPLRKADRHYFRVRGMIRPVWKENGRIVWGQFERVVIHNISRSGLGFLSPRPLQLELNVQIRLPTPGDPDRDSRNLLGVVVRNQAHGDQWYTVGCRLHRSLQPGVIGTLQHSEAVISL